MAKEFPLAVVIRAVDRVTAPMTKIRTAIGRFDRNVGSKFRALGDRLGMPAMTAATRKFGTALGDLGRRASIAAGAVAGIGAAFAGLGIMAVRSLVRTAGQFETFRTVLETLEGSSAAADKSMRWVQEFAKRTPYALDEVMDSFVKLRAYGIDPTNGTLEVLGDTATAMGKPVMQAVEAIADAMTGENERLKEFGIRARKEGNRIVYEYSKNGQTMRKAADASNRAMIQATLMAIWNDRYGGAMEKQAGTWSALLSRMSDSFEQFKLQIMASGPFELLKTRLGEVLATFDRMAESGELQALAERIGGQLVRAFEWLWSAGQKLVKAWPDIVAAAKPVVAAVGWLVDRFGAGTVIISTIAGAITLFLVPALYSTIVAFKALAVAILTTPVGWILAAIAAIAAGAYLIYKNWGPITDFFGEWWSTVKAVFGEVVGFLANVWADATAGFENGFLQGLITLWQTLNPVNLIVRAFTELGPRILRALEPWKAKLRDTLGSFVPDWAERLMGWGTPQGGTGAASTGAAAIGRAERAGPAITRSEVRVDLSNLPRGTRVEAKSDDRGFELNQGFAFG